MRTLLLPLLLATPLLADVIVVPLNGDKPVTKLRITLSTGTDGLRSNSTVSAFVILRDGRRIDSKPLNCNAKQQCAALPSKSTKTLEWTIAGKKAFTARQVHRFGLVFRSGKAGTGEAADKWDLTAVGVGYVAGGTSDSLLSVSYLGRDYGLKSGDSWEKEVVRPQRPNRRPPPP